MHISVPPGRPKRTSHTWQTSVTLFNAQCSEWQESHRSREGNLAALWEMETKILLIHIFYWVWKGFQALSSLFGGKWIIQISMAQGDVPRQLPALFESRKTKKFQNESRVSENKSKLGMYTREWCLTQLENQETFSSPEGRLREQIPWGAEPPNIWVIFEVPSIPNHSVIPWF